MIPEIPNGLAGVLYGWLRVIYMHLEAFQAFGYLINVSFKVGVSET